MSYELLARLESELSAYALMFLRKSNIFKPFGGTEEPDDDVVLATADGHTAEDIVAMLAAGMRAQAEPGHQIKAGGLCWLKDDRDEATGRITTTINVQVEALSAEGRFSARRFRRRWLRGVEMGDPVHSAKSEPAVFAARLPGNTVVESGGVFNTCTDKQASRRVGMFE